MHGAAFSVTVQPLTERQTGYTAQSFEPICQTFKNDQVIVVKPDSPLRTVRDLVDAAKARPGGVNYGHPGIATIPHLGFVAKREPVTLKSGLVSPYYNNLRILASYPRLLRQVAALTRVHRRNALRSQRPHAPRAWRRPRR